MAQTPDDDAWLEQIRCPQFFDFDAALTVPCPNGGDTNPPLRDSCYESDDETRTFFRALETDSSLHHTPHPQENSPPRAELRNLRPIYRHRPTTTFEEYVHSFTDSHVVIPSRESQSSIPQSTNSPTRTPSPKQKASLTPRRNPKVKTSRTPLQATAASNAEIKTPTLDTVHSKPLNKNPSTPCRLRFHASTKVTRKSAPNEPVPIRRGRPPERVTPPSNSNASKTTSGGFGRAKSRKAIAHSDKADGHQGQSSRIGKRTVSSENTVGPKKNPERGLAEEKEKIDGRGSEANLLDVDPDILRMMEEHNRRIQQKHAQNEGKAGKAKSESGSNHTMNNRTRDHNRRRQGQGITVRNTRKEVPEALQWDEHVGERAVHSHQELVSSKGKETSEQEDGLSVERHEGEWRPSVKAKQQVQQRQNRQQNTSSLQQRENLPPSIPNDDNKPEETSLDELLKYENERVLEERKKRLPERRRALQHDKSIVMKTLEGQRAELDRQRTLAKVEFTSANASSRAGPSALFEKKRVTETGNQDRGKENRTRDRPMVTKPRKRGLQGFREKSKTGPPRSGSSGISTAPSYTQKPRNAATTRRRQPYTDKIKAAERQKRLEKRLEEDLQSLLSQHNSRVQGNRRACAEDER